MSRIVFLGAVLLFSASAHAARSQNYEAGRAVVAGLDRIVTPNGVDETFVATLGGVPQVVNVRGADRANPILLYIHGGPAAPEMPIAWAFQRPWEDFFTVVQWDQRGSGRSFLLENPKTLAATLTVDRYRDDAIQLIELLRRRYGKQKVFVFGHSWGSVIGLSVAIKRPDLLYAYIGLGQVIDFRENERVGFQRVLAEARQQKNATAVEQLHAPEKHVVWLEHSAHLGMIEEPGRTLEALIDYALPLAQAQSSVHAVRPARTAEDSNRR